jgi:hypothetical protein
MENLEKNERLQLARMLGRALRQKSFCKQLGDSGAERHAIAALGTDLVRDVLQLHSGAERLDVLVLHQGRLTCLVFSKESGVCGHPAEVQPLGADLTIGMLADVARQIDGPIHCRMISPDLLVGVVDGADALLLA